METRIARQPISLCNTSKRHSSEARKAARRTLNLTSNAPLAYDPCGPTLNPKEKNHPKPASGSPNHNPSGLANPGHLLRTGFGPAQERDRLPSRPQQ
jgi:hypothetical protein